MSDQEQNERERAGSQDVEAHRAGSAQHDEPKGEEQTETAGDDEVEAHRAGAQRAGSQRASST